jgi:hypothetical protein
MTILKSSVLMAAVFAGSLVAACSDASLTAPSAAIGPVGAAPASTGAAADVFKLQFSVDLTVPPYPVCPLTPPSAGTITGTGVLTVLIRSISDASGGTHLTAGIHGNGTATDALGNRWVWSDADLNNEVLGLPTGNSSGNSFSNTQVENFHVIGPKGQQIKVKGTFHITQVNGTTVVEVEKGNHEEAEICESGFVLTPLP